MKKVLALFLAFCALSCSAALAAQEYRYDPESDTLYRNVNGKEIELPGINWQMKGNDQEPFLAYAIMDPAAIPGVSEESGVALFNLSQDETYVGFVPMKPEEMKDLNVVAGAQFGDFAAFENPADSTITVYSINGSVKKLQQVSGYGPVWALENTMLYTAGKENPPAGGRLFQQVMLLNVVTGDSSVFKAYTDTEEYVLNGLHGFAVMLTRNFVSKPEEWGDLRAVKSESVCEWLPGVTPEEKRSDQYIIEDDKLKRIVKGRLVDVKDVQLQYTKNIDPNADSFLWFPVGPDTDEVLADEEPGVYFYHPQFGFLAFHPMKAAAFCSEVSVVEDSYMFDCGTSVVRNFLIFKFVPGENWYDNYFEPIATLAGLDSAFWLDSQRVAYTLLDTSCKRPPVSKLDCGFSAVVYEIPLNETVMLKKCTDKSSFAVMGVKDDKIEIEETYVKKTKDWKNPEKYQRRITKIDIPAAG